MEFNKRCTHPFSMAPFLWGTLFVGHPFFPGNGYVRTEKAKPPEKLPRAMCLCNFCKKRGGSYQRCACSLTAYCSKGCFDKDHTIGKHGEWCIIKNKDTTIFQCVDLTTAVINMCIVPWIMMQKFGLESVVPLFWGVGQRALFVSGMNPVNLMRMMRKLHGADEDGGPKRLSPPIVMYRKLAGEVAKIFPNLMWFRSRMVMESGTVVPFLVCPVGTKSVSVICKGKCVYTILVDRVDGGTRVSVEFSHYKHAQYVVTAVSNMASLLNQMSKLDGWRGGGWKAKDTGTRIKGSAEEILKHMIYKVEPGVGAKVGEFAPLPKAPVIVYIKVVPYNGVCTPSELEIPKGTYELVKIPFDENKGLNAAFDAMMQDIGGDIKKAFDWMDDSIQIGGAK